MKCILMSMVCRTVTFPSATRAEIRKFSSCKGGKDCKSRATSLKRAIRVKRDQLRPQLVSHFFPPGRRNARHVE